MAIRHISGFRVLVVPGLHNSGPGHWQTRWQELYPAFERVEQADWDKPQLDVWSERMRQVLCESTQPTLIVAHSFGCLTTVHCTATRMSNVVGALLVAPADPEKFHVAAKLHGAALPYPSIVIGSSNDPWMAAERAAAWAGAWSSEFVDAGALGHINADSGLADWAFGLGQLQRLVDTVRRSANRTDAHGDDLFAKQVAPYEASASGCPI